MQLNRFARNYFLSVVILTLFTNTSLATESRRISFNSADGLSITADRYTPHKSDTTPLILLFHQAGSSRGEYNEIAPHLNQLGFNAIAVDLRSGEYSRGKNNETAIAANKKDLSTSYADALPDIITALKYAHEHYSKSKIIICGSSYSAALVLKVAGDYPQMVDGVIAFSPGEYFSHLGKSKTWIRDAAKNIKTPVFITSAKSEAGDWAPIYDVIDANYRQRFIPATAGKHGSKALWKKYDDSAAYWKAVTAFLQRFL